MLRCIDAFTNEFSFTNRSITKHNQKRYRCIRNSRIILQSQTYSKILSLRVGWSTDGIVTLPAIHLPTLDFHIVAVRNQHFLQNVWRKTASLLNTELMRSTPDCNSAGSPVKRGVPITVTCLSGCSAQAPRPQALDRICNQSLSRSLRPTVIAKALMCDVGRILCRTTLLFRNLALQ